MNRSIVVLAGLSLSVARPISPADDAVDRYIVAQMTAQHIPGLSLCVARDDRIVKTRSYGLANVELNVPATGKSEFAIASMTKSITASAIMLLVQDGKLTLDDPITKYLGGLPESWKPITVRHLLTHTSGIKDHYHDFRIYPTVDLDRRLEYTDSEYVKAHVDAGLNFTPGEHWAYSGSNYAFLGMIITKVTGRPYAEFIGQRIFSPLGMSDTHFIDLAKIIPHRAAGYWFRDGALKNGGYTGQTFSGAADISVITTAGDLCKWSLGLTSGKIWKKAIVSQMREPARLRSGEVASTLLGEEYGLGWLMALYNGYSMIGHGGTFVTGFTSSIASFPEKGLTVVLLTNQYDADPAGMMLSVAGMYDAELVPPGRMTVHADPRPELVDKVKLLLSALFGGEGDVASIVTPGFGRHIATIPRAPAAATPPPPGEVSFISSADISRRGIERYGSKVARMSHYKVKLGDETHYITLYLTSDDRVGGVSGF
jgi:CubicO group peptidase (beta-lactamase class C family)